MKKTVIPKMSADELKAIRAELRKTQSEMSALLGVTLRGYQNWEGGERTISGPAVLLAQKLYSEYKAMEKEE
jgi:DNA-binding transcriptional regulator YiaG